MITDVSDRQYDDQQNYRLEQQHREEEEKRRKIDHTNRMTNKDTRSVSEECKRIPSINYEDYYKINKNDFGANCIQEDSHELSDEVIFRYCIIDKNENIKKLDKYFMLSFSRDQITDYSKGYSPGKDLLKYCAFDTSKLDIKDSMIWT